MAPWILPYLAGRPLNLHRFPDGVERKGFWQKQAPKHAPDWIERWTNPDADAGESQRLPRRRRRRRWCGWPTTRRWSCIPGRRAAPSPPPDVCLIDLDPGARARRGTSC